MGTYSNALAEVTMAIFTWAWLGSAAHLDPRRPGKYCHIQISQDGADWELLTENMRGGVMDICAAPEGKGVLVATANGEVVEVDPTGDARRIIDGLPCITAMALGA